MTWREFEEREIQLIQKAKQNDTVSLRFLLYWLQIKEQLGRNIDWELVNDTYLYLTTKYNEDKDFVDAFVSKYKSLKGERVRDNYLKKRMITNAEYKQNSHAALQDADEM